MQVSKIAAAVQFAASRGPIPARRVPNAATVTSTGRAKIWKFEKLENFVVHKGFTKEVANNEGDKGYFV